MKIEPTKIPGACLITMEPFTDERGTFSRAFCRRELEAAGLSANIAQVNLSTNKKRGTLRGLHSQKAEFAEDKLVTCLSGAVFDVCVDVRPDSSTYLKWVGAELTEKNNMALYVPKGCAHGYLALTDDAKVLYFVSEFYEPGSETGYRYDDPAFAIDWPIEVSVISDKDRAYLHI